MLKMLTYRITTHFNEIDLFHPRPHTGVDYATPLGTQAQSISDGIVGKIANDPMLGENVRVTASGGKEWVYGHLSKVDVSTGQSVKVGDQLGLTGGQPGTFGAGHSTGPHLHVTLLQNGTPVDPISAMAAPDGGAGWWSNLGHVLTTPPTVQTPTDHLINFIGSGLTTFIHVMPEVCGMLAMILLLAGMCGSTKAMRATGTAVLLMFVGTILNAAIS